MSDKPASPFARLDTDLLRSTRRSDLATPHEPEPPHSGNPETLKAGLPEIPSGGPQTVPTAGNPEILKARKPETRTASKPVSQLPGKPATQQEGNTENLKTGKATNGETGKYSTQLRAGTIKQIKRYALDNDLKDYEVVQAALDAYFGANKRGE